jgi:hypothetical protein
MKNYLRLLTFLLFFYSNFISAQVQQEWVRRYNGPANLNDFATCMALDVYGNVYVSGEAVGTGTGNDIVTVKYNSSGTQVWVQTYNLSSYDVAFSITVSQSGNVYLTGTINSEACIILKYNSSGTLLWSRQVYYALGLSVKTDIPALVWTTLQSNIRS